MNPKTIEGFDNLEKGFALQITREKSETLQRIFDQIPFYVDNNDLKTVHSLLVSEQGRIKLFEKECLKDVLKQKIKFILKEGFTKEMDVTDISEILKDLSEKDYLKIFLYE